MAAIDAGATHVQGTINGCGERTGNANLVTVVANLQIKHQGSSSSNRTGSPKRPAFPRDQRDHHVAPYSRQPYRVERLRAHKAGLHAKRHHGSAWISISTPTPSGRQ